MFLHVTMCNTKYKSPKNYELYLRKWRFSNIMGFQNASENEFYGFVKLVVWLWNCFGKVLESFLKEFV